MGHRHWKSSLSKEVAAVSEHNTADFVPALLKSASSEAPVD